MGAGVSPGQTFLLYAIGGLLALYLLTGAAILQWTWREIDRGAKDNGRLYWAGSCHPGHVVAESVARCSQRR